MRKMFDLDQEIKGAKRIGIAGHIRPDGDCVGSCVGLGLYLRENYPELEAVDIHLESVPEKFRVLEGTETICTSYPEKTYDVFFSLDCGDIGRLGNAAEYLKTAGKVICVDHHISNHGFGDVQFIEPAASSTSELIYLLLDDAELSVSAAKALYMGIAHDTGVFQYSCTSRRTMEIAGKLMEKGFDFNELLDQIIKRLKPIADKKKVELVMENFKPVVAQVDETKLSLALSNLVENAIKYNKDEGWVHVSLNVDHKYFYVKVEDSGIGIPEESQEHIFERFYRVDKSHSREIGGTGLGLAITRSAVLMHRGAIKVYSKLGEGTTFTVRIPLIHAE